jgi:hypothetical protein
MLILTRHIYRDFVPAERNTYISTIPYEQSEGVHHQPCPRPAPRIPLNMPPPAGRALRCSHRRSRPRQCSLLANAARSLRALPCSRPLHGRQAGTGAPLFPALALYMEGKPAPKSLLARPLHGRQAGAQIAARPPSTWKASWHPNHCSRTGSACSLLANAARSAPRSPCSRPLHGRQASAQIAARRRARGRESLLF